LPKEKAGLSAGFPYCLQNAPLTSRRRVPMQPASASLTPGFAGIGIGPPHIGLLPAGVPARMKAASLPSASF
jgi:hypothetical protein